MLRKRRCSLAVLLVLSALLPAKGQTPPIRNYTRHQYKGGSQNWNIVQGTSGYMYFANNAGLLAFNGYDWTLRPSRPGFIVRSLLYSPADTALYYAESNQLKRARVAAGALAAQEILLDGAQENISEIWDVVQIGEDLVFRDEEALYRYGETGLKRFAFKGKVDALGVVDSQAVVSVRGEGLMRYDGNRFVAYGGVLPYSGRERIIDLLSYDGKCLIVTETSGLFLTDGECTVRMETPFEYAWPSESVFCAAVSTTGKIALGTVSSGVYVFGGPSTESCHLGKMDGLQNNTILSALFDRNGDLWLGLDNGLAQVSLSSPEQPMFHQQNAIGAGYASAQFGNELYLGTNEGLFRRSGKEVTPVDAVKGQVWDLCVMDDALFCCTDRGLHVLKRNGRDQYIPLNGVWKVVDLKHHPGAMLGSTYDRMFLLSKLPGGAVRFEGYVSGFEESSKVFEEDRDGRIWFSHWQKGLFRLELSTDGPLFSMVEKWGKREGFPTDYNNIPNRIGDEIVFTTEKGFYRLDATTETMVPAKGLNDLFKTPPPLLRVFALPDGIRYFSSGVSQVLEYPDKEGKPTLDSLTLGYLCENRKLGFDHIRQLSRDKVLINTEDGFSVIRVDRMREGLNQEGFVPVIHAVHLTGMAGDSLVFASECPGGPERVVSLPHRSNSLRFDFVSPGTGGPETYEYMLENYDAGWSSLSTNHFKEYTKLPPGNYVFRVRTPAGESALSVRIIPPWYRTGGAYTVWSLLVLAGLALLYLLVERRMRLRTEQEARKTEEVLRKEQLLKDLENKANDLAAYTMDVIRKNEILRKIDASLEQLGPCVNEKGEGRAILRKLRENIRENLGGDNAWKQFETNFDIVHQGFMKHLKDNYPTLGKVDRRICAYLKMGLRTKEIASLMNMTPRSVEMTRHRIRRKMGLSRTDNLSSLLDKL